MQGNKIKTARTKKGLSQEQVASKAVGITTQRLHTIEIKGGATDAELTALARVLGVDKKHLQ